VGKEQDISTLFDRGLLRIASEISDKAIRLKLTKNGCPSLGNSLSMLADSRRLRPNAVAHPASSMIIETQAG
jgi:hypothetical protein